MKARILTVILSLMVVIGIAVPVMAYTYSTAIYISENGTGGHGMVAVGFNVNNEWLIDNGFMTATGLNTRIVTPAGSEIPHMVADNTTWFAIPVSELSFTNLLYTFGNSALSAFYMIFGDGSYVTVSDNEVIEMWNGFTLIIDDVYLDMTAGAGKHIVYKPGAFDLRVSETVTGNLTAEAIGGGQVSALSLPDGEYDLEVSYNGTHMRLWVNTLLKGTVEYTDNITDTGDDWLFFSGNTTRYVGNMELYIE
jgi:hypothetical protein